ncbi:FAD-binding oxidoreductase [Peribacillus loiseleuriae]|uniref:FAD-binding oxidoreductase n=1 Tax=Peribacillus loiseleuriae TaxID=1679170 RepID=UPI003CFD52D9
MEKTKLTGRIVTPNDSDYEQARINLNLSIPKFPRVIVFCQNVQDVVNALKWARENRFPFRLRSGRHSFENFSLVNRGLIIDVSEMNQIICNRQSLTAKIEAGAGLGKVYQELWKCGVTIPAGTSVNTGIVGLTLGGGIGLLTRLFGLTCDNLLELEMVKASSNRDAEVIKANKYENSDLFWASRGGGGGNFGIVTSLTFRVHPISDVSIFSITWGWEDFEEVFNVWQNWAPFANKRLTSTIELRAKEVNRIEVLGEFVGPIAKLKQLIQPLLKAGSPIYQRVKEVPYIDTVQFFDSPSGDRPTNFKRSGSFIEEPLPREAILKMKQFLARAPNENAAIWHQSLGGAVGRLDPKDTAYYYREAIIAQEYISSWNSTSEERQNVHWIESLRRGLSKNTMGDYVNWPDIYIKDWPNTYYGENANRLRKVKTAYDPYNVFTFPQSIPPFNKRIF